MKFLSRLFSRKVETAQVKVRFNEPQAMDKVLQIRAAHKILITREILATKLLSDGKVLCVNFCDGSCMTMSADSTAQIKLLQNKYTK